ncbi:hypothetical protein CANMA_003882 [Candida margitis]|uniref:uncharacterized protein n=1 Tax=Candida margitis TaxID=1775924 RepID=UPI002226C36D|nr:uncharacterized protein CANMA_003882 [Candida margitis]KAI5961108.1 hypothetical protein CANMA_003882 [Candida margitis]
MTITPWNVKTEKNQELIEFAKKSLNYAPHDDENYQLMISGMSYDPAEQELTNVRMRARDYLLDYGNFRFRDYKTADDFANAKRDYLAQFIGHVGPGTFMEYPMFFDYGFNTYLGKNFYSNFNLTILDCSVVKIGDNVMCGTNVSILTPGHPIDPNLRVIGEEDSEQVLENALPVTIGDNCWLCGGCTIIGGVTIGEGCVIGAGSVVTRDVPANSLVVGVPARVVKTMDPKDKSVDLKQLMKEYKVGEHGTATYNIN